MARLAGAYILVYESGFPDELSQIIAGYADWDNEDKMYHMFKVNSRRNINVTDAATGLNIQFKRDSYNRVFVYGSIFNLYRDFSWYETVDEFTRMLVSGKLKKFNWIDSDKDSTSDILRQQVINRWNSL